jgi:membrane protein implicated in regulation of membrane protease activity
MAAVQPVTAFQPGADGHLQGMATPRMMIIMLGAAGVIVAAVAALALGSWVVLVAVLAVHLVVSLAVIWYSLKKAGETEGKPDPLTEARIEEEQQAGRP